MRGRRPKAISSADAIDKAVAAYRRVLVAKTNIRICNHLALTTVEHFHNVLRPAEHRAEKAFQLAERRVRVSADVEQKRMLKEKGVK